MKKYKYTKAITIGHGPNGKAVRKYFRANTRRELNEKIDRCKWKLEHPEEVKLKNIVTFSSWANQWLELYKEGNVIDATYEMYKGAVKRLNAYFQDSDLRCIRQVDIQKYFKTIDGLSSSYTSKLYMTLDNIFKTAIVNGYMDINPLTGLTHPKGKPPAKKQVWTKAQVKTVLEFAKGHPFGIGPIVMLKTGLRRGELMGLMPAFDIKINDQILYVHRTITDVNGVVKIKDGGKSKSAERVIPLDGEFMRYILSNQKIFKADGFLIHTAKGPAFPKAPHNWANRDYKKFMNDLLKEHPDLPRLTPHELRHTYGTLLSEAGTDINTIKEVLGHASISTTAKIYVHQSIRDLKNKMVFPDMENC